MINSSTPRSPNVRQLYSAPWVNSDQLIHSFIHPSIHPSIHSFIQVRGWLNVLMHLDGEAEDAESDAPSESEDDDRRPPILPKMVKIQISDGVASRPNCSLLAYWWATTRWRVLAPHRSQDCTAAGVCAKMARSYAAAAKNTTGAPL